MYHMICNTSGATSGAGTAYPSEVPEFTPDFQCDSCYSTCCFLCSVLQIVACPFSFGYCVIFDLRIIITSLVSSNSSYMSQHSSKYCVGAMQVTFVWPLCCLSVFFLRILITPLVSSHSSHMSQYSSKFCCCYTSYPKYLQHDEKSLFHTKIKSLIVLV